MSVPPSSYSTAAAAASQTAAATASQTAATVVGLASPRIIFVARLCALLRICSIINPLSLLVFNLVLFEETCPRARAACSLVWHVTLIAGLVALAWDVAVVVSMVRTLRGRRAIPYLVHANMAAAVATSSTVCFGVVVSQVVKQRHGVMSWWGKASLLGLTAALMVSGWNDFAWAVWGWKWLRRHKLDAHELLGPKD